MKNYNIILREKQQMDKYEYLAEKEILPTNQRQMILKYSPLGKASEKQSKKQVDALKSLNLSNKIDELKQISFQKTS